MHENANKTGRAALLRRLFREDPAAFAELVAQMNPPRPEARLAARHIVVASYPQPRRRPFVED
jgi:hypothetical protein